MPTADPNPPAPAAADLDAFVDGELDDAARLRVLGYLAQKPEAAKGLFQRQQLKAACARVMATPTTACPADLRRRLADLAIHEPLPRPAADAAPALTAATDPMVISAHPRWNTLVGRWSPLAAAAVFFIAAIVALQAARPPMSLGDGSVVPVAMVEKFQARHSRCGRQLENLFNAATVADPAGVSTIIHDRLGVAPAATPQLDLSALGYRFAGVGDCSIPGGKSLHLLYRADPATGRDDALSLWIAPVPTPGAAASYDVPALEEGRAYPITGDRSAHPMIVWRSAGMIYYLVGDAPDPVASAAQQITQGSR